jgi:hypothetical protein
MLREILMPLCLLAFATPAVAQEQSPEEPDRMRAISELGRDLYAHDQSAWRVTDALFEAIPDAASKRVAFVSERIDADRVKTTFLLRDVPEPKVLFSGIVEGSKLVSTENLAGRADAPLATAEQIARMNAVMAVRDAIPQGLCGKPLNTIVLDSKSVAGVHDVYVMIAETNPDEAEVAGHQRFTVGPDGKIIGKPHAYSNSCLTMKTDPPPGATEAFLFVTLPANISDVPTEIHVFVSLSHAIPLFVSASSGLWEVRGSRIRLVTPPKAQ